MAFLENLKEYLGRFDDESRLRVHYAIAAADARRTLVESLERVEREGRKAITIDGRRWSPGEALASWQVDDRIVRFANGLSALLSESIGSSADPEMLHRWIRVGIARMVGLPDALDTGVRTAELHRLCEQSARDVLHGFAGDEVATYADEIRAVRAVDSDTELTPIGRVFLDLAGRDALRWLLHVEAAQAIGPRDPWRLSRPLAASMLATREWPPEADLGRVGRRRQWTRRRGRPGSWRTRSATRCFR